MDIGRNVWLGLLALVVAATTASAPASAQQQKPNILVIIGDDIGYCNVSCYNQGMMRYRTPHIDRLAHEGAVHRLLRAAELHGRTVGLRHRSIPFARG